MSEAKFTKGPWRVEDGTTMVWGDCNPEDHSTRGMGYPIAEARINPSGNWSVGPYADEGEANARLIAAAPEMYEALKAVKEYFGKDGLPLDMDIAICDALNKAEGRGQ